MIIMNISKITLGGGCFWCLDAAFRRVEGVLDVVSGFSGGVIPNPTYELVVSGRSGHAEVVDIEFDNDAISLDGILDVFFRIHDPTTVDRQGNDIGEQYRSIILYRDDEQKEIVERFISRISESGRYVNPIVTEVVEFKDFYSAEDYHQDYYRRNPRNTYCRLVISPKIEKVPESKRKPV